MKLADGPTITRTLRLPGNRSDVRERSTTVAMHLLRRALPSEQTRLGLPAVESRFAPAVAELAIATSHVTSAGRKALSAVPKRIPVASLPINVSIATASNTGTIVTANAKG